MNNAWFDNLSAKQLSRLIVFLLVISTLAVYWQVHDFKFIDFDDHLYVEANPIVQTGLNRTSLQWAFTDSIEKSGYWIPLTWVTFLLEFELWGLNAGGYHVTNVILHILNTLLLFYILKSMTGGLWQSAFVAALFALHPMHVESVVWVTERKDVLSTFFWLLTIGAYYRYVVNKTIWNYVLALLFFCLGLMSKPMLLTLPFVLLLLDYWPLKRIQLLTWDKRNLKRQLLAFLALIREKVPFFLILIVASVVAFITQKSIGAVHPLEEYSFASRLSNVPVAYIFYITKMFWPHNLAIPYVHPGTLPIWQPLTALLILSLSTFLVLKQFNRLPYLTIGWFWYMGTLFPVCGIIVFGDFAVADRYSYVPHIGLFIMLAWGAADIIKRWYYLKKILISIASIVLFVFMVLAWHQVSLWKDDMTLFSHTLNINENSWMAHSIVGDVFLTEDQFDKAAEHYRRSLQLNPGLALAHFKYGFLLMRQNKWQEALVYFTNALEREPEFELEKDVYEPMAFVLQKLGKAQEAENIYRKALQLNPETVSVLGKMGYFLAELGRNDEALEYFEKILKTDLKKEEAHLAEEVHLELGRILEKLGRMDEAETHYREIIRLNPDSAAAYTTLGILLARQGRTNEAVQDLAQALKIAPQDVEALNNMGNILKEEGRLQESINYYEKAIDIKADYAEAHNNLGLALLYLQKADEAEKHFREALRLDQMLPEIHGNLGVSMAQQGKLNEALGYFREEVKLSPDNPAALFNLALALYDVGKSEEARQYLEKAAQKGYPLPYELQMLIRKQK